MVGAPLASAWPNHHSIDSYHLSASTTAPATTTDWAEQSMEEENNNNAEGQTDGASEFQLGSTGLLEPEFDVNVTLSDQQANPNDPLYSIKSFGDLDL